MPDLSQYSDEELMAIAGIGNAPQKHDLSQVSDEELMAAAGIQGRKTGDISKTEAIGRGAVYGALQQPRDVAAAAYAKIVGGIPFKDALNEARSMSLEGRQGDAQQQMPGYFGGGTLAGNIATSFIPAGMATKAISATAPVLAKAPMIGGALSNVAKGIGASKGFIGVPVSGAIQGATSTAMTDGDLSGAIPGAIGAGVVSMAGKIARPIAKGSISKARQLYVDTLKKAGVSDFTPGQLTGNSTLDLLDSVLANMPFTAGPARKKSEQQLRQFTKAALKFAGTKGDEITPEVRQLIEKQFSQRYKDLISNETVNIDEDVLSKIAEISAGQLDKLPTNVKPIVQSYMRDILQSGGKLSGRAYQTTRSAMTQQARSMAISDPFTANVLRELRNTLDDAAERSLPEAKKGLWSQLNKQYANYKSIQKAASTTSKDSLEGILSPGALNAAVETANKTKGQAGYGELYNLSRSGRAVLADSVPNSGTAQRQIAQQILTGGGLGVAVGGGTYGATQDPESAMLASIVALGGPRAVQAFLNSRAGQEYFTKGIPGLNALATPTARKLSALLAGQMEGK